MLVPYAQLEGAHKMYFIFNSTNECTEMSVTITVEITNKLLRHVSTHEVSSSGSSLVLAKITYECTEMCKNVLKCAVYGHTHTICDFNQLYERFNEF